MDAAHGQGRRPPKALERHHGHAAEPRHRGVYQWHRQTGLHPQPHSYTARKLAQERPRTPGAGNPVVPAPLHHHQHAVSSRHLAHPRRSAPATELGQIIGYDPSSGTATVQLLGSTTQVVGPLTMTSCAPRDLVLVGASCLVVLLDAHNPRDGVVVAVWPASGTPSGARLTQAGTSSLSVVAASTASLAVAFPTAYTGAPVVVATSTDPSWAATVAGITASGFTVTIRAAAPATTTVAVEWMASGQ